MSHLTAGFSALVWHVAARKWNRISRHRRDTPSRSSLSFGSRVETRATGGGGARSGDQLHRALAVWPGTRCHTERPQREYVAANGPQTFARARPWHALQPHEFPRTAEVVARKCTQLGFALFDGHPSGRASCKVTWTVQLSSFPGRACLHPFWLVLQHVPHKCCT